MKYSNTMTLGVKPAYFHLQNNEHRSIKDALRNYAAPMAATIILGGLLVGNMAVRCLPLWS